MNRLKDFLRERRGNVAITFALAILPIVFAMGMGIDYSMAAKRRAQMNAAADAAALSTVTPAMMQQTTAVAQARAIAVFNAQVAAMSDQGIVYNSDVQVTVSEQPVNNLRVRTTTVLYNAKSMNAFGGILNMDGIPFGNGVAGSGSPGTKASAQVAANIDFYLMIDTSPSMAIAATQADINTMLANTPGQDSVGTGNPKGGCAFACHEAYPQGEGGAVKDKKGNYIDNYQLARNLGVTLRIDLVQQAIGALISTAKSDAVLYNAKYRLAGYGFDLDVQNVFPLTAVSMLDQNSIPAGFQMMEVWSNNVLCGNAACTTAGSNNNDQNTDFNNAFSTIHAAMPNPGGGSNNAGDTPQEVLFLVTDGVNDSNNGGRNYNPFGGSLSGGSPDYSQSWCDKIKKRGIRIAVLYTTYLPLPTNNWYWTQVRPVQNYNGTADTYHDTAQACASSGLFAEVQTGGDISAALVQLFKAAITSAHLTQ